jgi:hypothetical protein
MKCSLCQAAKLSWKHWGSSSNGGLAAADRSIEEDRDRNMVVTTTTRTAIAIVIRIMTLPLFGRDCACRVAHGASKDLLKSLAALPLLIGAPKLNGRRYGAISASGKRLRKNPPGRTGGLLFPSYAAMPSFGWAAARASTSRAPQTIMQRGSPDMIQSND